MSVKEKNECRKEHDESAGGVRLSVGVSDQYNIVSEGYDCECERNTMSVGRYP